MPDATPTDAPAIPDAARPAYVALLESLADDKLMLGHLNSDWTGLAPTLEEDIAFSALAQDDIAHAQAIYQRLEAITGTRADDVVFGREPAAYRSAAICEHADDFDWAKAIARQLYVAHYEEIRLGRLARGSEPTTAALARRMLAEQQIQIEHVDGWMRRLARDADARNRVQAALDALAADAATLLEPVDDEQALIEAGLYPAGSRPDDEQWRASLAAIAEPNGYVLSIPAFDPAVRGGRRGVPGPRRAEILDEMCEVYRLEPGASW